MSTSVGMKLRKKQSSLSAPEPQTTPQCEQSIMVLEDACVHILQHKRADKKQYSDHLYWQQCFKNIATPVSLALAEYKGPKHFHNHYRHREDDETILHPVLEPAPLDMLAQVCEHALTQCHEELVGLQEEEFFETRNTLEDALQSFLACYKACK